MALPIWALYMQKCYANKDLEVSFEDFEKPDNFSINVNCTLKSGENEEEEEGGPTKITDEIDF